MVIEGKLWSTCIECKSEIFIDLECGQAYWDSRTDQDPDESQQRTRIRKQATISYSLTVWGRWGSNDGSQPDQCHLRRIFGEWGPSKICRVSPDDCPAQAGPGASKTPGSPLRVGRDKGSAGGMKTEKTPGMGGALVELYQMMPLIVLGKLIEVYVVTRENGELMQTMREATVVLIAKEGKDPNELSSSRPLSMLNTDLKIFCKALANRLLRMAQTLIHSDQTGFIPVSSTMYDL
ncbi:hypothetical protein NDU88_002141 [Pleurodeles waltl]|uniref:Reverse transcriptase n=1 Tax=Pleurodeles waltl TaxID=8319 RepID=A0AAV7TLQ9_PLEWA|nr:hypothetical protein NDU88_002141 [Pleurodeles waltl]